MHLQHIALENFRNYRVIRFEFDAAGSLVIGENGSGKTNLLEAMAYCGIGKSIRFHSDQDLLHFGTPGFTINAVFNLDTDLDCSIGLSFTNKRKLLRIDGEPIKNLSHLIRRIKVIYCAPEDLSIIAGSPKARRQYFDLAIAQLYPEYMHALHEYLHILEQRNSLLKNNGSMGEKKVWDGRFTESALHVLSFRRRYLRLLNQSLERDYRAISESINAINIDYHSSAGFIPACEPTQEQFHEKLKGLEQREYIMQHTLMGPHLDDYEFMLNETRQKTFSSQGQKRISVILVKLIQAKLIEEVTGIKPILLFDDIFAELDAGHTEVIRDLIGSRYQVFITSPKAELKGIWHDLKILEIGRVG